MAFRDVVVQSREASAASSSVPPISCIRAARNLKPRWTISESFFYWRRGPSQFHVNPVASWFTRPAHENGELRVFVSTNPPTPVVKICAWYVEKHERSRRSRPDALCRTQNRIRTRLDHFQFIFFRDAHESRPCRTQIRTCGPEWSPAFFSYPFSDIFGNDGI